MYANYHTHTRRCGHAEGSEREYIEEAIKAGIRILGFSDHSPYPFPDGYYSDFRMPLCQAEEYFASILHLREEYHDRIELHVGVEVEYYAPWHDTFMRYIDRFPCEYLILGQHFIGNETDRHYASAPQDSETALRQYVDQILEGLSTGSFFYLAHPDLIRWEGTKKEYVRQMQRLCSGAKEFNTPLEINLLGLSEGRNYPCELFWKIAGETGNQVILGCDAHKPEGLAQMKTVRLAEQLAAKYHLNLIPEKTIPANANRQ